MPRSTRKLAVFPAFHKVAGRRVVIVGGGGMAAAKVRLLSETAAEIVVFAEALSQEAGAALIAAGGDWRGRRPSLADLTGAALIFAATGEQELDQEIRSLAREAGVPVNVVDRPDLCDFYTPALVNRAPLAVAIGTEGAAPVLARHVRSRMEALLAPALGDLAGLAAKLRGMVKERRATVDDRRRFWARFFSGSIAEKVFAGRIDDAEAEARSQLIDDQFPVGHVSLVGAGPGAEDLLTLRAQRALQEADVIVYDRLVPEGVVAQGRREARRVYVGKAKGDHVVRQEQINALLVREAKAGNRVVRLKSGDPLIFGRAGEEIAALRSAGVSFDIVPGITAAFAAAAAAEIPLTMRGTAAGLVFASGHDSTGETLPGWAGVAVAGVTVAVYMGRTVAGRVATRLIEAGMSPSTPVTAIENASRHDQRAYIGRLDQLDALAGRHDISGPVLIIVGEVVAESGVAGLPLSLAAAAAA